MKESGNDASKIDQTDLKIIEILQEDGRTANNEIAARLSLSEGTIRNRIAKLVKHNYLKVRGLINPSKFIDKQLVYLLLSVPLRQGWMNIGEKLAQLPEVRSVSLLTGRFDMLLEVFIAPSELAEFISEKIGILEGVNSTESIMVLKQFNKWI
ncbi:MAG: Lrp/AsnC family transcriptional regulator [Sphaerochaetaceae bacterium]|jgi:Lrp/AsnC family transcriptional regulator for asnA, asnC and gidA|nr:Lrp/AsnC family transcriptional regulator [Sphaerochaetaceae bacterium]